MKQQAPYQVRLPCEKGSRDQEGELTGHTHTVRVEKCAAAVFSVKIRLPKLPVTLKIRKDL